jgi:hypothetical protein
MRIAGVGVCVYYYIDSSLRGSDAVSRVPVIADGVRRGAEIVSELQRVHAESVEYWRGYTTSEFFHRPAPDVWAPVDQVRHLTKSMRAMRAGFDMPKVLLLFRFGIGFRSSRGLEELRRAYDARLRPFPRNPFAARELDAADRNDAGRAREMQAHAATVDDLCRAIGHWSEASLDRFVLPHPLLGRLTAREMGIFAVIHNVHHVRVAEGRRGG